MLRAKETKLNATLLATGVAVIALVGIAVIPLATVELQRAGERARLVASCGHIQDSEAKATDCNHILTAEHRTQHWYSAPTNILLKILLW